MSVIYKIFEFGIKAADLKHYYDMPEEEFLEYLQKEQRPTDVPDFLYEKFNVTKTDFDGRYVFKIAPKSGGTNRVILFLHGGGGILCPMNLHYKMAAYLVENTGATMYFPFYPLAPEFNVLETMDWLKKLYADIVKRHNPKNITFIGDSAGGFLAARLCSLTADKPGGVVLISPVTGVDKKDEKAMEARRNDIFLSERLIDIVGKYWGEGVSLDSPDFNAEYIDYRGFPPVILYYGTNEMFYPYMCNLIDNIKKRGVPLETHEGKGLCHDWAIALAIPEGKRAIQRMCAFVNRKK